MTDFWAITGWAGTFAFGALNVFQFVKDHIAGRVWKERVKRLRAVQLGLGQLRAMLTESEATGEVVRTDAVKQFIRQIGHHVKSIEHHIDGMLEDDAPQQHAAGNSSNPQT